MKKTRRFLLLFILLSHPLLATKYYVKTNASGANNGSSWENAFTNLQSALAIATANDVIWVANGTFKPTTSSDRSISFVIPSGVQVFGGFKGDEPEGTTINSRDLRNNVTILNGDIGTPSVNIDNSHHVVTTSNVSIFTLIDGFLIINGNSTGGNNSGNGGGWLNVGNSKPVLRNIRFDYNIGSSGAAMYNNGGDNASYDASPTLINCVFSANYASVNGGAVYNRGTIGNSSPKFINCNFFDNKCDGTSGAIYNYNAVDVEFVNTIFRENYKLSSSTPQQNDITNEGTKPYPINRISHCILQSSACIDSATCTNNYYNTNPLFQNESLANMHLTSGSPAISSGLSDPLILAADIENRLRIRGGNIDIGAYEYNGGSAIIYVDSSKYSGLQKGFSWENAFIDLQDALAFAEPTDQIWIAKGTYFPTSGTSRNIYFEVSDSVEVYGGFAGNEASNYNLDLRDFTHHETILSGDLGIANNKTDNSYHVVFTNNVSEQTTVNGITIKAGNANSSLHNNSGGGWLNVGSYFGNRSSPKVINVNFINNSAAYGGAMENDGNGGGEASPSLLNCSFLNNSATIYGGAMYNWGLGGISSPSIIKCAFLANSASIGGGAIFINGVNGGVKSRIENCLFHNNGQDHIGYFHGNVNTQPHFFNCTFSGATSYAFRIDQWNTGQTPVDFTNCIFWGNNGDILGGTQGTDNARINIMNSIVEESAFAPANNNINQDPLFIDAANGIFNLKCNSPAINQGTFTGAPTDDITGFVRVGLPDMGAYEYGQAVVDIQIANGTNPSLSGVPILKASSHIENTNNVLYQGINNVQLLPGFSVAPTVGAASVFRAEIGGGCL